MKLTRVFCLIAFGALFATAQLVPIQATSVVFPNNDLASNVAATFFNTITNFSLLNMGNNNWRGVVYGTTLTTAGYWIEGHYSNPFVLDAYTVVGYSTPFTLFGSNDGMHFSFINSVFNHNGLCATTWIPCVSFATTDSIPYSIYRLVTPSSNYNYAVTLFSGGVAPPPAVSPATTLAPVVATQVNYGASYNSAVSAGFFNSETSRGATFWQAKGPAEAVGSILGYSVQAYYATPLAPSQWLVLGYSAFSPVYLMGSVDNIAFTQVAAITGGGSDASYGVGVCAGTYGCCKVCHL